MSSALQTHKAEEKLGLIISRVRSIRARVNSLAWQRGIFGVFGSLIAAAALLGLAAFYTSPLIFLAAAGALAFALLIGLVRSVRVAWRMHATVEGAAEIADERADLRGRLLTIVYLSRQRKVTPIAGAANELPLLWPYLIEDAL